LLGSKNQKQLFHYSKIHLPLQANGEMAERSNAAVLKTVVRATGPGVRIPLSPHHKFIPFAERRDFYFQEPSNLFERWMKIKIPGKRPPD
jgi:hypothetical protein